MQAGIVSVMGLVSTAVAGGEGGYLYTETRSEHGSHQMSLQDMQRTWGYMQLQHCQTWCGADGSGLIRQRYGPARFFTAEHERRWEAEGSPELPSGMHEVVYAPGCMEGGGNRARLARMPTDPAELHDVIKKRRPDRGLSGDEEDFLTIGDLLGQPGVQPELCDAIYRVGLRIPRVADLGEVRDRAGRVGLGMEMLAHRHARRLIFAPDLRRLFEVQETMAHPYPDYEYAPPGTITGWTLLLEDKHQDPLPDDAPPLPGPPCPAGGAKTKRTVAPGLTHVTGPRR